MKNSIIKNTHGVSYSVGYVLSLGLTAIVITASLVTTTSYIDRNISKAAEMEAEILANQVANLIKQVYIIKHQYPDADYTTNLEIPYQLMDRYTYKEIV